MERFNNHNVECVVLARKGDKALICKINETVEPFVVPSQHIEGESDWQWGTYFASLDMAYAYFMEVIE